jgi:hypothetical protein
MNGELRALGIGRLDSIEKGVATIMTVRYDTDLQGCSISVGRCSFGLDHTAAIERNYPFG